MSTNFADSLTQLIRQKNSCVVVGLDPRFELLPEKLRKGREVDSLLAFNKEVIDIISDHAVAVKPQIAFYELLGHQGFKVYEKTCDYARSKGLMVICDVKRADIPETARAYAKAYFEHINCDAVTLNPYFGSDSIKPFIEMATQHAKGLFIVTKSTNPSGKEIQDLKINSKPLYLIVTQMAKKLGKDLVGNCKYSSVGLVVSALHKSESALIRRCYRNCYLLIPGYGAQGASTSGIKGLLNPDGLGAIVSASRSIIHAYQPRTRTVRGQSDDPRWWIAIENSIVTMKQAINSVRLNRK